MFPYHIAPHSTWFAMEQIFVKSMCWKLYAASFERNDEDGDGDGDGDEEQD